MQVTPEGVTLELVGETTLVLPEEREGSSRHEILVQFSSKQENQTIIALVNNLYQNYQVSLNYLVFV